MSGTIRHPMFFPFGLRFLEQGQCTERREVGEMFRLLKGR